MKLSDLPLSPCCPNCGKSNYKQRDIKWIGVEIMLCDDCGYSRPVVQKTDPRAAHASDKRQAGPL